MQQKRFERASLAARLGCDCELKALLNSLPGVICCRKLDSALSFSFVSSAMHSLVGYRSDELVNHHARSFDSLLHPQESLAKLRQSMLQQIHQKQAYTLQYRVFHRDGSLIWLWESGRVASNNRGQHASVESILIDVTELHKHQLQLESTLNRQSRELHQSKLRLAELEDEVRHDEVRLNQTYTRLQRQGASLSQLSLDCALADNMEALAGQVCGTVRSVLGCSGASIWVFESGKQLMRNITPAYSDTQTKPGKVGQLNRHSFGRLFSAVETGIAFASPDVEKDSRASELIQLGRLMSLKSVMLVPFQLHKQSFGMMLVEQADLVRNWQVDELNFAIAAGLAMTTRMIELESDAIRQRLHSLAYFDGLTQLENRQLFNEQLKDSLARINRDGMGVALLFIDLNDFKTVNDKHGHAAGDALLKQVAYRLKNMLRKTDHAARIGGDEFVVLLHNVNEQVYAAAIAEKLLNGLVKPYTMDDQCVEIGASIGIAMAPEDGVQVDELMHLADKAMYRAKGAGVSSYQFADPTKSVDAKSEFTLLAELKESLALEQMELVYLPQIRLRDGKIQGAEALLRWRHPRLGVLPPAMFIELAERNKLLKPIGDWVCRQVVEDAHALSQHGKDIELSFNMSNSQMDDAGLVGRLKSLIEGQGIPKGKLRIELKESTLLQHEQEIEALLTRLHQLGVGLTIDNFGAGPCALETLSRVPVDLLKIDQRLLRDTESDPARRQLASTLISLGSMLGKSVVAEGIETQGQANFLDENECEFAQGFYYYRPMGFDTLTKVLH
ncbi:EAL domain-containing protein [Corallincola platygyrae]|uniref:EAL domain-containing protein n=1 Tax=Corallincola platygyrae TaxID=1193278 RepID=A0ABW4XP62_9GAMM